MGIKKQLTLNWAGKEVTISVTMDLINRLDEKVNLAVMLHRTYQGDVRLSHAATLLAALLTEGGVNETPESVYEKLFSGKGFEAGKLLEVLTLVFSVIFPTPKKKTKSSSGPRKVKKKK